jgi:hypothetical protein
VKLGTVTWKMASTLMTWERKFLRKIYGPKSEQGVWRIRSNLEIQNMYKSPDIVTEIKVKDWNGWDMSSEWKILAYQKWYLMLNQKEDVKVEDLD